MQTHEWPTQRGFAAEPDQPWDRRYGEPPKAYRAFMFYRDQGEKRGLRSALRAYRAALDAAGQPKEKTGSTNATWATWSMRYEWPMRVLAYDDYIEKQKQKALEQTLFDDHRKWADRTLTQLEQGWVIAQSLYQVGMAYLHASVTKKTEIGEDGSATSKPIPGEDRHSALIAERLLKSSQELGAVATQNGLRWVGEQSEQVSGDNAGDLSGLIEKARKELILEWKSQTPSPQASSSNAQLMPPTSSTPSP